MKRRLFLTGIAIAATVPGIAFAQERPRGSGDFPEDLRERRRPSPRQPSRDRAPSSTEIMRELEAAPQRRLRPEERVTIQEFRRRPDLRRSAPSIDIQAINFAFASADIPRSEYLKVREIANALNQMSRRRNARFLIEGHTDAVGSRESNQALSERRAEALRRALIRDFDVSPRTLETVGYGKDFLLINTPHEEWRNRRVTLRRIDEFVR